jgi:hypothetical protein
MKEEIIDNHVIGNSIIIFERALQSCTVYRDNLISAM